MSSVTNAGTPRRLWYRTTLFNAYVIGLVGFTAPGLWNAMNSLGAGGAEEPFMINASNALVFALMAIFCLLGNTVANRIGLAWTLVLGAVGYPLYSAGLYTNVKFGTKWFVLVGAAIDGISAGLFWASEGAVAVGYPEPSKRGRYLNIWVFFRTAGPLVGGAIVLGLNHKTTGRGHVGTSTYLIFIALQCLSVPIALLLSKPGDVQRSDGSKVTVAPRVSFQQTLRDLYKTLKRREVLLLMPFFFAAYFNSYSSTYTTLYFGVRARALMGFTGNFSTLVGSLVISYLLDYRGIPRKNRLFIGFGVVVAFQILAWVYAVVIIADYQKNTPVLDWLSPGFTRGFFVIIWWNMAQQMSQNFLYYLMGTLTNDINELTRLTGILRGSESAAQAIAYGINANDINAWIPVGINVALLLLAAYPTWLVVRDARFQDETTVSRDPETAGKAGAFDSDSKADGEDVETASITPATLSRIATK